MRLPARWGLVLLALVALVGCRAAPPDVSSAPDAAAGWTVLIRAAGPRWLGPEWWRKQGLDPEALGPDQVHLQGAGAPASFLWLASPEGPGLLFFGEVRPGRIGPVGAYTLTIGAAGMEMAADAPTAASSSPPQESTQSTLHLEEDNLYRSTAPLDFSWLWASLNAPAALTLTVPLTEALPAPVTLTLRLWGQSNMPQDPDHHIRVVWNGVVLDDHFWNGSQMEVWTVVAPDARPGDNVLVLESPGDTEAPVEVTWLDGLDVTWRRALRAGGVGWETWLAGPETAACWDGLSAGQLQVLKVGPDGAVRSGGAVEAAGGRLCVAQTSGDRGWVGRPWDAPSPDVVRPRALPAEDGLAKADYLVVAPGAFHEALAPLIEAHRAEGVTVALVTPEQIYDAFGEGFPDGAAIRRAVLALHATGQLRYLLLVGDASADPRAVWAESAPLAPTAWVRTAIVGETPSDQALVTDDAGKPLVAIGRFPASTVAEVEAMVAKTLAWQPNARLLLLSDDEPEFAGMADALEAIAPADLRLDAGNADARRDLLRWLKAGAGTLIYSGHGSMPLLGDEKLLTIQDAGAWDGPTVVVAWTCLCANFTHPAQAGLGEAWLRDRRGAVAVVGPTGETTTSEQSAMALAFQRAIAGGATLGDALLEGWQAAQSPDAKVSFVLLGDPALQPLPERGDQ